MTGTTFDDTASVLHVAYQTLSRAYGPQGWWPAATREGLADPFEILVGAILVQHTNWKSVTRAIASLEEAGAMSARAIHELDEGQLAKIVRSAGPPTVKARRLQSAARFLIDRHGGRIESLLDGVRDARVALERRAQLLSVHGIGPETADAVLLYAGGAPLFVVDAYKRRVMQRHGWSDTRAKYDDIAQQWRRALPPDVSDYQEAHALLVRVGVEHCRKPTPRCDGCPLQSLLPSGGPRDD